MEQKKSHNITPRPEESQSRDTSSTSERVKKQGREQAIISPDRAEPSKASKKGPLSVGVNFDKSQG